MPRQIGEGGERSISTLDPRPRRYLRRSEKGMSISGKGRSSREKRTTRNVYRVKSPDIQTAPASPSSALEKKKTTRLPVKKEGKKMSSRKMRVKSVCTGLALGTSTSRNPEQKGKRIACRREENRIAKRYS